jgi:uncharacterized protein (TIGR02217 family)
MGIIIHNTRLPDRIESGAKGGPRFNTFISSSEGGAETATINWTSPLHEYDVAYGIQERLELDEVRAFFISRRGRAYGFLFKDWNDYSASVQLIGVGNGTNNVFQLTKTYTDAILPFTRKITRPVVGTVTISVNAVPRVEGTHYNVNYTTGVVTFTGGNTPPNGQNVTSTFQFDVPVRFESDSMPTTLEWQQAGFMSGISIREVRE